MLLSSGLSVPMCVYICVHDCLWNRIHIVHTRVFYTNNIFVYALGVRHNGVKSVHACVVVRD